MVQNRTVASLVESSDLEKKRQGNEHLTTNKWTMSCYYIVQVLRTQGCIQIKKKRHLVVRDMGI